MTNRKILLTLFYRESISKQSGYRQWGLRLSTTTSGMNHLLSTCAPEYEACMRID